MSVTSARLSNKKRSIRRHVAVLAAVGAVVALTPSVAMGATEVGADRVQIVIGGLDGPRGLAGAPPRRLVYGEADGTISQTILRGSEAGTTVLGTIDSGGFAPAVASINRNTVFILTRTLYMWSRETGTIKAIANIPKYQKTDPDPFNVESKPTESNPYGVAALADGSALVSDAAGNDLLRVSLDGTIETVARIKPRVVLVPDELEGQPGIPPPGTPIPAEGVATSITVGADGAYYLGELRGFPATPGTSEIWRIEPGSVDAVCDPENPNTGPCTRFADGLTSIVDLESGGDGSIYAVELVRRSWLQWELGIAPPIGGVFRVASAGATPDNLTSDQLTLPGGIEVTSRGAIYVAGPVIDPEGEGAIVRIR